MTEAPSAPPPDLTEAEGWAGLRVDDLGGAESGQAHGLFVDANGGGPSWLIVRQGRFRGTLVAVPFANCAAAAGRVWVAHEREAIRHAPVVDPSRPLLREHELTICAHYGIGESVGRASEVAGRSEGSVTSQPA
jgi:hypothetical protein